MACASGSTLCCAGQCANPASDFAHCGGCRACGMQSVSTPMCNGGFCTSLCAIGFGNCVTPPAPAADDGCETDVTVTTAHCGGCGRACSPLNVAAPACLGSVCTSTCNGSFGNCVKPVAPLADDGCETDLALTTAHCGQCGRACSTLNVAI